MIRRNTIQKEMVLQAVRALRKHATAEEVYEYIRREHPNIGKGTVYRNLNILAEEGEVKRVEIPNGSDRYDFTLKEHYHLRCVKCQEIYDVDMEAIPDIQKFIRDMHGMKILSHDILFKGFCSACCQEEKII